MKEFVRGAGNDVFLDQHLHAVGSELKQAERTDTIWAEAILDAAKAFALEHGGDSKERGKNGNDGANRDENGDDRLDGRGKEANDPVLEPDKELVNELHETL